jgi:hypothetical protein
MNIVKIVSGLVAGVGLIGFVASQAAAGTCQSNNRPLPANPGPSQDLMTLSCSHLGGPATTGTAAIGRAAPAAGGALTVTAGKTAGGAGLAVVSQCLNSSGNVVGTPASDVTIGGANPSQTCPAATTALWRGLINHVE